jgi:DNA-binding NtrC family response regulator
MRKYLVLRNAEVVTEDLARRAQKLSLALKSTFSKKQPAVSVDPSTPGQTPPRFGDPEPKDPAPSERADSSILKGVDNAHRAAEAEVIIAALNAALWNRKQAAALLKIDYKALLYKMKKLGIGDRKIIA